jgi:hypothetical protein
MEFWFNPWFFQKPHGNNHFDPKETYMKISKFPLALAAIIGLIGSAQAQQQSTLPTPRNAEGTAETKPHVGARLGFTNPAGTYENALEYGAEFGFQPYIPFGLGLEVNHYAADAENNVGPQIDRTKVLIRGTYNFGGTIPVIKETYLGALIGPVFDNIEGVTYGRLGTGLVLGADFPLGTSGVRSETVSLGANVNYLAVVDTDADDFTVNGAVKYWF